MHEVLNLLKQQPSQKLHKNFINFENPQNLSKIPKVWSEDMKCMRKRERERQSEKNQTILISKDKNSKVRVHENA